MTITKLLPFSLFLSLSSFGVANTLEEVLVTGELREIDQLKLATSISVIGAEQLVQRNASNMEDILGMTPNVNFASGASRGRFLQIRGTGNRSEYTAPTKTSVGVVVDGIDFTGMSSAVLDAGQVEVFRGPQGTLYGANALAGLIHVSGNSPTDTVEGELHLGFGNYNSSDFGGTFSTPLTKNLGWRIAAQAVASDGYIHNSYLDRDDTNNIDERALRNQFRWQAEQLQVDFISYLIDFDNGYDAFSLDNNRTTLSDQPGRDIQKTQAHSLKTVYTGASVVDVQLLASVADSEREYGYDEDWSFADICPENSNCAGWQYSSTDDYAWDNSNVTVDMRLLSKSNSALRWVVGVYSRQQQTDLDRVRVDNDAGVSEPYSYEHETTTTAIYGQVDFALTPQLNLVTGLRNEWHKDDFFDSQDSRFKPDEQLWGGKLALEFTTDSGSLVYGLISRGYNAGGFNPEPTLPDEHKYYDTEIMINYEAGVKGLWLDQRLRGQVAVFYQQRDDVQAKLSYATNVDDFKEYRDNATGGTNLGLEADLQFNVTNNLELFASLGLLQTEFDTFYNTSHVNSNLNDGIIVNMKGRDQAQAPHYSYYAGARFDLSESLYFRLALEGKDQFYFSDSHETESKSYNMLNLRLGYDIGNTSIALWGKNLTDQETETRGFYFSNDFGNDPRKLYAPEPYTQKGAPFTFGVSIKQSF